ncbi:hypothetical protein HG535_0A08390 [Zygotorulaspora mrakii]|uniref:Uncharacterized protein n=1 Tax=Zygotorulaspora mrakii TaxID=42260 RepID=A0A7H9AXB4_ZYGMR|nr:uncharacterized protein HG535_0A08390 [Zygotorulaspora mrakii]QLG70893.1 hypothetical protein HG535_0A08390 [Zygotorulaspora mrakii]
MVQSENDRDLILHYFDVYNAEVRQFFQPLSFDHYDLRGSHVHADSRVRRLEEKSHNANDNEDESEYENEDENEQGYEDEQEDQHEYEHETSYSDERDMKREIQSFGSFWTASEKAVFFHFLARYSIHKLDEWRGKLPYKSKFEILTYFEVLKNNLAELKRSRMKTFGGILSRMDLPIAYEVDECFLSFDENMSHTIRSELEPHAASTEQDNEDDEQMISFQNWNKRWKSLYSKANVEEILPMSNNPLPLSEKAMAFLVECCKNYARKLVWATILIDFEKKSIFKDAIFGAHPSTISDDDDLVVSHSQKTKISPHIVTEDHVSKAISYMKMDGKYAPTLADTVLQTLDKFELKYDNEGKLFKNNKVTMSLLPSLLQNATPPTVFFEDSKSTENTSNDDQNQADLIVAKKLYKLNGGKPTKRRKLSDDDNDTFIADDEFNRIDNPLELHLCDWEAELMDAQDQHASQIYQHTLLTYFARILPGADTNADTKTVAESNNGDIDVQKSIILESPPSWQYGAPSEYSDLIVDQLPPSIINRFLFSNT